MKGKKTLKTKLRFREDETKYNAFLTNYQRNSDDNIKDINERVNHSEDNGKDNTQYVITAHPSNKSFMYLLMTHNTLPINKDDLAQYIIIGRYIETVLWSIIPDSSVAEVLTARKSQFKVMQRQILEIE